MNSCLAHVEIGLLHCYKRTSQGIAGMQGCQGTQGIHAIKGSQLLQEMHAIQKIPSEDPFSPSPSRYDGFPGFFRFLGIHG
jgi:hypothetical protein